MRGAAGEAGGAKRTGATASGIIPLRYDWIGFTKAPVVQPKPARGGAKILTAGEAITGVNGASGTALIEIYEVAAQPEGPEGFEGIVTWARKRGDSRSVDGRVECRGWARRPAAAAWRGRRNGRLDSPEGLVSLGGMRLTAMAPAAADQRPADMSWCEGRLPGWRRTAAAGLTLSFILGAACIREIALHPAGNWALGALYAAGTAAACVGWVALRRLVVVAVAGGGGPDYLLRGAHVRSGFIALGCAVVFAVLGRVEFGLLGRSYGDVGAGYAAGLLIGLCLLFPAVVFTVGATHRAARRCKAPELARLRASGARTAPWEEEHAEGWVVRHWRGRYALPRAFWLHGVALYIAVSVFATTAGLVSTRIDVGLSAILTFAVLLLYPPILVWQEVGIWRAATQYARFHGRRRAAWCAKAFVILSAGFVARFYATGAVAQARSLVQVLEGDPEWTAFSAIVDPSGRELTIRGNLQSGCHWDFDRVLAASPGVRTVMIDSPGGRLAEGERIAAEVRRRRLDTCAVGECESAATVVFLAGARRTLGPHGTLGFHSPSLPEASALLRLAMQFQLDFDMKAAGVSEPFILKTLRTPPDDMWYPPKPVLEAAGVLTRD